MDSTSHANTVLSPAPPLVLDGTPLSIDALHRIATAGCEVSASTTDEFRTRIAAAAAFVDEAIDQGTPVYGINTGFGGLAAERVPAGQTAASQENLLDFLATGAGEPIEAVHVRAAMALRANVLSRGCSGVRYELIKRLIDLLRLDVVPVVRELGSIGASGDLVPLAAIARAATGRSERARVWYKGRQTPATEALRELGLAKIELKPKEGLALVNGTSFSAAVAANAVHEAREQFAVALAAQGIMLRALDVQQEPFAEFVHRCKPHPGQRWVAETMRRLLPSTDFHSNGRPRAQVDEGSIQDRYSLRCLPQYLGPIAEGIARVTRVVETEMNAVSDNPIIDLSERRFYQSGNFLGQGLAMAMDDLRRFIGLTAKHLDVQIATLVTPSFSKGLPSSLRGNEGLPYNMGLKGLQITGNSIMPLLTHAGQPLVDHYPTHAEQFNQNINGLSWGAALLAWNSVKMFRHYLAVSLLFAVQAIDLRSSVEGRPGHGRSLLGPILASAYDAVHAAVGVQRRDDRPFLYDDSDHWLEACLESLAEDLRSSGELSASVAPLLQSFAESEASL